MRVTILNQFYKPDVSPTAHLSASLAEHLARQGHEVTAVASRGGYVAASKGSTSEERAANPRIFRIWTPRLGKATTLKRCTDYGVFYLLAFWRLLRLSRQDVVISLTTPPYIAWAAVAHKLLHRRAKVVLWNMDCYPEVAERAGKLRTGGWLSRAMRAMNRALFRRIDHLVCLDTAMVDLLLPYQQGGRAGSTSGGTTIIPNWEPAAMFPADAAPEPWEQAEALGLNGRFVILYLGNLGFGHGFETVLDAAEMLRNEPVTFLFVGGGARGEWIRENAKARGLEHVLVRDYVPKEQTPSVMASADCALITLRDDMLGVMSPSKLHANLAMGLPVVYVGPTKSNVDDAIEQFGCGVSLRHGQAAEFASFIRQLLADERAKREYRQRARQAFDRAYCDACTLPRFEHILAELRTDAVGSGANSAGEPKFVSKP